jgi:hypothetical protein
MPAERRLLRETITYSEAKERDVNILQQLPYWSQQNEFFRSICSRRDLVELRVAHHLRVPLNKCHADDIDHWMHGSFNLCVPVTVDGLGRVIIRFPLPYRVGDKFCSGNGDEKVKCEAGTYAWMHQYCPTVPIPRLYGFALSTGHCVRTQANYTKNLLLTTIFIVDCFQLTTIFSAPVPSFPILVLCSGRTPSSFAVCPR